jgi:hypothetical protein
MLRLLGYVIFDSDIENITLRNYDTSKLYLKATCISSIDDRTKLRLWYLAKDIIKTLSYTDFDKLRKDVRKVIISMIYNPVTTKTEVYTTGVVKTKLYNSNNTYLHKQLSIATDYFTKDILISKNKYAV